MQEEGGVERGGDAKDNAKTMIFKDADAGTSPSTNPARYHARIGNSEKSSREAAMVRCM